MQQGQSWEKTPREEGRPVDLVLEGGGVKGIGLVGAISILEEEGYRFQNIAGTSAGAIVAALLGAGYTADELHEILLKLNFEMFKDEGAVDRIPLVGQALSILIDKGIYEGERFQEWMREMLSLKLRSEEETSASLTFGELPRPQSDNLRFEHRVQIVTSDLTTRDLLILPQQAERLGVRPDDLAVAVTVRMSTSIPIFFEPVWFPEEAEGRERHLLVDGGVLSNFPVWLFDVQRGEEPRWPTFGLRLFESPRKPLADDLPSTPQQAPVDETESNDKDIGLYLVFCQASYTIGQFRKEGSTPTTTGAVVVPFEDEEVFVSKAAEYSCLTARKQISGSSGSILGVGLKKLERVPVTEAVDVMWKAA